MGYAVLYSGGKDSTLALWRAQEEGLDIDILVTIFPQREDSYMFHRPNLELVPQLAGSLGIQQVTVETCGEKEFELKELNDVLEELDIDGVVSGAVASTYQRSRIDSMCIEHGWKHYAPLWGMKQRDILELLVLEGFQCIIVSVAAMGLDDSWLGKTIDQDLIKELQHLKDKYRINVAGEGGEYESLVLGSPNYRWDFDVESAVKHWDGHRGTLEVLELKKRV